MNNEVNWVWKAAAAAEVNTLSQHVYEGTKSLYLTKHHTTKTYWGGGIAPCILELGTRRR
jgi:hypothetical protein